MTTAAALEGALARLAIAAERARHLGAGDTTADVRDVMIRLGEVRAALTACNEAAAALLHDRAGHE